MTKFSNNGDSWQPHRDSALKLHDVLPPGNYTLKQDMFKNYFFEAVNGFMMPPKLYGDVGKRTKRVLATFLSRPSSTGILLSGEKGSGKTLLAKNIAVEGAKMGIPTVLVNQPHCGDMFNSFIASIDQPMIVMFDEFEKVYNREDQERLLTLLDGVYNSQKLFILTCNDPHRVDYHMKNRPGRVFYFVKYGGLDEQFIREYCEDTLEATHEIDRVVSVTKLFGEFNFDMLKALVEEMNRFGETPQEALALLNASPEADSSARYDVSIVYKGVAVPLDDIDQGDRIRAGSPLSPDGHELSFRFPVEDDAQESDEDEISPALREAASASLALSLALDERQRSRHKEWVHVELEPEHFVRFDPSVSVFTFRNPEKNCTVYFTRVRPTAAANYFAY